jgi:hypothetical protein
MPLRRYKDLPRRLVALYPKSFRDRFGPEIEQTLADVTKYEDGPPFRLIGNLAIGIAREHISEFRLSMVMNEMITNPKWAAVGSSIMCLPLLGAFLVPVLDIEPFLSWFKAAATIDGQQINSLGRVIIFGGVLLLPLAVLANLSAMFTRRTIRFRPRAINLVLGCAMLSATLFIGGWMVVEAYNCSKGICD